MGEAGNQTSTEISTTGQGVLGAYSYKTPRIVFSIESFQDIDEAIGNINLFKQVTASRLARGIAKHLVIGDGSSTPLGLIPSLEALGVPFVTASGSAVNTGGSETGANSPGSEDFSAALALLDEGYVGSAKCAWFMTRCITAVLSVVINVRLPCSLIKSEIKRIKRTEGPRKSSSGSGVFSKTVF